MKKLFTLCLCALLTGCSSAATQSESTQSTVSTVSVSDAAFEDFLDQYVIDLCSQDALTAHHYFQDPEAYGIDLDKCEVTLGSFVPTKKQEDFLNETYSTLQGWNTDDLSKTNRQIFEQLLWEYDLQKSMWQPEYLYLDNIWSSSGGVQTSLVSLFSEFQLYGEEDIDLLVELIADVPRYVDEALDHSKEQVKQKTFAIDMDTVLGTCQDVLASKDDSPITAELNEEIDALDLDEESTRQAKAKVQAALAEDFFPAYETMEKGLKALEKDNGEMTGMASLPGGEDYYALILQYYSGCKESPEDLMDEMLELSDDILSQYQTILKENPQAIAQMDKLKTKFKSISDIMPFLEERYPAQFPLLESMDYEIKPLSNEQSANGTVAYFVVPPIDSSRPYEIRYNKRDYGDDPTSLDTYTTFAHEGIPGHMYQAQYNREHFTHPVQYMMDCFAMQEGYASYAAAQTLSWTGLDEDALEVWRLNEQYSNAAILIMDLQINAEGMSRKEFADAWGEGNEGIYDSLCEEPGLFFGYYYGSWRLEQLQQIAKETLSNAYDPIEFNNAILQAGNVEFEIVEENVQDYIDSIRKTGSDSAQDSSTKNDRKDRLSETSKQEESEQAFVEEED